MAGDFLNFLEKPLDAIDEDDIDRFKSYLVSEKNYSKASQHLSINAVKLLLKANRIPIPTNLTAPRRQRKMPVYLSTREAASLLKTAGRDTRISAIINTLIYTGLRVGELCSLNTGDIDMDEQILYVKGGKGDKDRIVIVADECIDAVKDYMKLRKRIAAPTDALFVSNKKTRYDTSTIERMVRKAAVEAGISKKVTPHVLRHTFATSLMRNGGDIRFIQELLGHSSVATTQIYTHMDESTLKDMYRKHRPRF